MKLLSKVLVLLFLPIFIPLASSEEVGAADKAESPVLADAPVSHGGLEVDHGLVFASTLGWAGYSTYELFQDKKDTLGWINGGLWAGGLTWAVLVPNDPSHVSQHGNGAAFFLVYPFCVSFCYPVVTLLDGSNNSDGKLDRAWIGVGSDVAYMAFIIMSVHVTAKTPDIRPVVTSRYSGLVWSNSFQ